MEIFWPLIKTLLIFYHLFCPAGAGDGHISLESVMTKLDLDGAVFNRTNLTDAAEDEPLFVVTWDT